MKIFNKQENNTQIEDKKIKQIINEIRNLDIEEEQKEYLIGYLEKIRKGYPNDFGDIDTCLNIILRILDSNITSIDFLEEHFNEVILTYHQVVNLSNENDNIKELFPIYFLGSEGILINKLFDDGIFSLFQNKKDYFDIMNIILNNNNLVNHFDIIKSYINSVCKYSLNQDILKRDIISFLKGFNDVIDEDYSKYKEEALENTKKRVGIYNINTKELAKVDRMLRKIDNYMDNFNRYKKDLQEQKNAIESLIDTAKEEIKEERNNSVNSLKEMIDKERERLLEHLNNYLRDLESSLKDKSDEVFRSILEEYKAQVEEFRNLFKAYSSATSKDLLEIQKATEESVKKLQQYVSNEPQLKELLKKANEENTIREKIVELVNKEEELTQVKGKHIKQEEVIVPGFEERVMVPYKHMILPDKVSNTIIKPLDQNIPFSKRKEEICKRIEERENKGEIFHKKTLQICVDLMEGDWPYLWGPSGTGKSYMVKQVASLLGMELTKAGKITEPYSILGYNDPQGRYQITPSFVAALYGNLLFLDELDNGNPDTQVVLNDIYSELLNKLENPNEISSVIFGVDVSVNIHPNFRMISAGNTSGEGENEAFSSRGKIDESIQQRMTPIFIDYDNRVESQILLDYPEWYKFVVNFREACIKYAKRIGYTEAQGITTTRDAAAIKKYIINESKNIDQILEEKFIQIKDSEYRNALGNEIAKKYGLDYSNCEATKYNGTLKGANGKVLAKKFIYLCKNGVE